MKALELFFKSKGITVQYGIVYNLDQKKEIRYWNENGEETKMTETPSDLEKGIFCFRSEDGRLRVLDE